MRWIDGVLLLFLAAAIVAMWWPTPLMVVGSADLPHGSG
jgi:hypothetical protein